MYEKRYGIIETLSQVHVGASAGEESGNLNLIFRDQFTQTGTIPGSSIRGRMRSEMRYAKGEEGKEEAEKEAMYWYGQDSDQPETSESKDSDKPKTSESVVKFEYASIVWLPVFCPGQPIVWVSCPRLLKRYYRIAKKQVNEVPIPHEYTGSQTLKTLDKKLFFNFGLLTVEDTQDLTPWFPLGEQLPAVIVADDEMGMIHDMALYRQTRVALKKDEKRNKEKGLFNIEALPEGTILVFPIALRKNHKDPSKKWEPFGGQREGEIYLGGLESIGFGHCKITLKEV